MVSVGLFIDGILLFRFVEGGDFTVGGGGAGFVSIFSSIEMQNREFFFSVQFHCDLTRFLFHKLFILFSTTFNVLDFYEFNSFSMK